MNTIITHEPSEVHPSQGSVPNVPVVHTVELLRLINTCNLQTTGL